MNNSRAKLAILINDERYPLSAGYDPNWVLGHAMGPNPLVLAEMLCQCMELKPGMRVLDMGCGRAITSIFLAKEFGVQVWANDLWIPSSENWSRIKEAGMEDRVFPIHAEAHHLPYAEEFFDAIVSMDSYHYYGTDDLYLDYFLKFLKRGGRIGIVVPGIMREFPVEVPRHLRSFWTQDCWTIHTPSWWRRHWGRTGLVEIETAGAVSDGGRLWLQWEKAQFADGRRKATDADVKTLEADRGRYLGFVRMVGRRPMVDGKRS